MYLYKKYEVVSITVLTGISMVAWQILAGPLNNTFQLLFFTATVFTFGIPHGALDHLVEQELARRKESSFQKVTYSIKYAAAITVYALCWYVFPQVSLLAFLLMSAWHFGETDFQQIVKWRWLSIFIRLLYGISILLWVLFAHTSEAGANMMHLVPATSRLFKFWLAGIAHTQIILLCSAVIIIAALSINQLSKGSKFSWSLILQLVVILTCGFLLPLLPAFALYFVGWHSIITLYNIEEFINGKMAVDKPLSIINLCRKALLASITAIGGLLVTGYLLKNYAPIFDPLPLLFVFLSLITLPHVQVMHKLNLQL